MATLTTKYSVGDIVWHAGTDTTQKQHPCPDCKGAKVWTVASPAGDKFTFGCPRCTASYSVRDELSLKYSASVPSVRRLTIGSVRVDTAAVGGAYRNDEPVTYMCVETGVGSGSIYRESMLFPTEGEALAASEALAATANATVDWIVKRYNKTLELSDYQLSSAAMKEAQDYKTRARQLLWNVTDLFDTIASADDKDAILEVIDDYKRFYRESDLKALAAQGGVTPAGDETGTGSVGEADSTRSGEA